MGFRDLTKSIIVFTSHLNHIFCFISFVSYFSYFISLIYDSFWETDICILFISNSAADFSLQFCFFFAFLTSGNQKTFYAVIYLISFVNITANGAACFYSRPLLLIKCCWFNFEISSIFTRIFVPFFKLCESGPVSGTVSSPALWSHYPVPLLCF